MASRRKPSRPSSPKSGNSSGLGRCRPRASVACTNCRARKVKCDAQKLGLNATCTPCRAAEVRCIVSQNDDRRRNTSKNEIAALRGRLHTLEAMMKQNLGRGESDDQHPTQHSNQEIIENEENITHVEDHPSVPSLSASVIQAPSPARTGGSHSGSYDMPMDLMIAEDNNSPFQYDDQFCYPAVSSLTDTNRPSHQTSQLVLDNTAPQGKSQSSIHIRDPQTFERSHSHTIHHQQPPTLTPPAEEMLPLLDIDVSSGQPRFYGPTTQLHMQSPPKDLPFHDQGDDVETEISVNLDSSQLRKSLLNSCWRYYSLQASVVDEQCFMRDRQIGMRSQHYSTFLEFALLACASRVSTSVAVRKLGTEYAGRAKKEIPFELECPTLASLQGFLLLSDFEATCGRDRLGWTYSGIACRLLFDFGLHEDCAPLVQKGQISVQDVKLRDSIFLGAFVYDALWSLYLGRPRTISLSVLHKARLTVATHNFDDVLLLSWVDLCIHIAEATELLNNTPTSPNHAYIQQLVQIDKKIKTCYDNLPPSLTFPGHSVAELEAVAYGLHMQFCGIRIVIHRSLIRIYAQVELEPKSTNNNDNNNNPDSSMGHDSSENIQGINVHGTDIVRYNPETSRKIMYESAILISQLVLSYRQIFGLDKFITIMLDNIYSAAVALINNLLLVQQQPSQSLSTSGNNNNNDFRRIRLLDDTLEKVQMHFPIAFRMRSTISRILRDTPYSSLLNSVPPPRRDSPREQSLQNIAIAPPVNSWGSVEALMNNYIPEFPATWSGMFDTRQQSWVPDSSETGTDINQLRWLQDQRME